jgi:CHAT domain
MAEAISYLDFDLLIRRTEGGYQAQILSSPAGQASSNFPAPLSDLELENFLLRLGRPRRGTRRIGSTEMESAKELGRRLYEAVFSGEVRACWRSSLTDAEAQGVGLRLRLHIEGAGEISELPWEYLYNASLNRFLSLSEYTPLVRYLDLPERIRPLAVTTQLEILVMISSPTDYPGLDVESEWSRLNHALERLIDRGLVRLERLPEARLSVLQRALRRRQYHVLHFVGHGGFDPASEDGVLVLRDEAGRGGLSRQSISVRSCTTTARFALWCSMPARAPAPRASTPWPASPRHSCNKASRR